MKMAFGKYNGLDISEVPDSYLQWLRDQSMEKVKMVDDELARRESIANANMTIVEQIINTGYRHLSLKAHPDAGGSTKAMQDLNKGKAFLLDVVKSMESEEA